MCGDRIGRCLLVAALAVTGCLREAPMDHIFRLEDARSSGRGALEAYLRDPSGGVRVHASRAAGRIADPRLVRHLLPRLDDPDPEVVREAAFALGQIALIHPDTRKRVAAGLRDRIVGGSVLPATVRMELLAAMGKTGAAASVDVVAGGLEDLDPEVRRGALLAAGRLGDRVPGGPLLDRLDDPDAENRWRAVFALASRDGDAVTAAIVARLEDGDPTVRRMAADALAARGDAATVPALADRLEGREWDRSVQAAVAAAVARNGSVDELEVLLPFVHALYPEVRAEVAGALARFGEAASPEHLRSLAEDHRALVRIRVVPALERHPDAGAGVALAGLTDDPVAAVRAEARVALARREGRSLLPLLDDPTPEVRAAAATALGVLRSGGTPPVGEASGTPREVAVALRDAMGDADPRVAAAATEGLARVLAHRADALDGETWGGRAGHGIDPGTWVGSTYASGAAPEVKRAVLDGFEVLAVADPCELVPVLADGDAGVRRRAYGLLEARLARGMTPVRSCALPDRRLVWTQETPLSRTEERQSLEQLPRECTIVTTRGPIYVDLARRDAPRAVAYLVDLARSGGLEGTPLAEVLAATRITLAPGVASRVMPGMGPRPEINPLRITRGSVLLLGPDGARGGCRIRVVMTPDPTLDGWQTVIGTVSHGWDVLTQLDLDDRILTISVS